MRARGAWLYTAHGRGSGGEAGRQSEAHPNEMLPGSVHADAVHARIRLLQRHATDQSRRRNQRPAYR